MRSIRTFLVLLAGAVACREAPDRERQVLASPYGELEVARTEEVSQPAQVSPAAEPPQRGRAGNASVGRDARPRTLPSEPAERSDTAGYAPYPADPPLDRATLEPRATVEVIPPDAAPPASDTAPVPPDTARVPSDTAPARFVPPEAPARGVERTVPAGTAIHVALEDSIHSRIDVSGKVVEAKVMQHVRGPDGRTLIPAGTPVQLTVTQVKPGRGGRKGVLEIRVDSIMVGGEARKLEATLQPVSHELRGRGVTGEDAAKVGVGAAGGAVVGRVLGGDTRGAVIGGVVGAAGGAVVASETAAKDVVVKARTPVVLVLTAPLAAGS